MRCRIVSSPRRETILEIEKVIHGVNVGDLPIHDSYPCRSGDLQEPRGLCFDWGDPSLGLALREVVASISN